MLSNAFRSNDVSNNKENRQSHHNFMHRIYRFVSEYLPENVAIQTVTTHIGSAWRKRCNTWIFRILYSLINFSRITRVPNHKIQRQLSGDFDKPRSIQNEASQGHLLFQHKIIAIFYLGRWGDWFTWGRMLTEGGGNRCSEQLRGFKNMSVRHDYNRST